MASNRCFSLHGENNQVILQEKKNETAYTLAFTVWTISIFIFLFCFEFFSREEKDFLRTIFNFLFSFSISCFSCVCKITLFSWHKNFSVKTKE